MREQQNSSQPTNIEEFTGRIEEEFKSPNMTLLKEVEQDKVGE